MKKEKPPTGEQKKRGKSKAAKKKKEDLEEEKDTVAELPQARTAAQMSDQDRESLDKELLEKIKELQVSASISRPPRNRLKPSKWRRKWYP